MKHLLFVCVFATLTACASSPSADEARWFTQEELDHVLPADCRADLVRHAKGSEMLKDRAFCMGSGEAQRCHPYSCQVGERVDCWWHEREESFRTAIAQKAKQDSAVDWGMFNAFFHRRCPDVPEGSETNSERNEARCRRNVFADDRRACVEAYYDQRKKNPKIAKTLLAIACDNPSVYCKVDGKVVSKRKKAPPAQTMRIKSSTKTDEGPEEVREYEYSEMGN